MDENGIVTLEQLRRSNRDQILRLAESHGARNVRVFGSVARGNSSAASDVDFLVDLDPDRTLMDLGGLLMDIEALLGERVDVTTERMLRPHVLRQALRDAVLL